MQDITLPGGGFKPTGAPAIWRPDPLPPAFSGSYRRAWLETRGFSVELAAVVAELEFSPHRRRA